MKLLIRFMSLFCMVSIFCSCSGKEDPVLVAVDSSQLRLSGMLQRVPQWDSLDNETRVAYVEHWVDEETVLQEALKMKIDKDPTFIAQREMLNRKLLVDYFLQTFSDTIMVSDAEKLDFYNAHSNLFLTGDSIATVRPFDEVAADVETYAWVEHRKRILDSLKREWKKNHSVFVESNLISRKEK